jgi:hypothetical protein
MSNDKDDLVFAEEQVARLEHELHRARETAAACKKQVEMASCALTWRNVLRCQILRWAGQQADAWMMAEKLGYPYYLWNDRVYWTKDGTCTDHSMNDIR